jgi:hypothetical protein
MEKKISEQWKDYLKNSGSMDAAMKASFSLYKNKYTGTPRENAPKEKHEAKLFFPGRIYTFQYMTPEMPSKDRPFIDRKPVILSLGQIPKNGKIFEVGIDFNLVPHKFRIFILDKFYNMYKSSLQQNNNLVNSGKRSSVRYKIDYLVAKKIFDGTGWHLAFQTFDMQKMKEVKLIDYEDYVKMISLDTKGIQGAPIGKIFDNYITRVSTPPILDI